MYKLPISVKKKSFESTGLSRALNGLTRPGRCLSVRKSQSAGSSRTAPRAAPSLGFRTDG